MTHPVCSHTHTHRCSHTTLKCSAHLTQDQNEPYRILLEEFLAELLALHGLNVGKHLKYKQNSVNMNIWSELDSTLGSSKGHTDMIDEILCISMDENLSNEEKVFAA
jgi:hypothetical protein